MSHETHDPSACLREAEAASLRRWQVAVRRRHLPSEGAGEASEFETCTEPS
jgi:hypothetical protein